MGEDLGEASPELKAALGDRWAVMAAYAEALATSGTERGLIGPREVPRLWERHIANCLGVVEVIEDGSRVADVGSGAGLPGLVVAIARPDVSMTLIEPLLRRTTWLEEVVGQLGLANVRVERNRAEALHGVETFDVVTSRAVAALSSLAAWCLPLVRSGGRMVAVKGRSAAEELEAARKQIRKAGGRDPRVVLVGESFGEGSTLVEIDHV